MNQQNPEEEVSLVNNSGGGGIIEAPAIVEEKEEEGLQQKQEETIESTDPILVVVEEKLLEKSVDGEKEDDNSSSSNMEIDPVSPATVFCVKLKQPNSNLLHKMSVPELCRNFSAVAWCGKLNAIACASETCARIPSSKANTPFWIPIHILIPERPTECAVFNVVADSPRDSVQFIEWSPTSCPRALLIANFHGRITIWTQPTQGSANLVHDATSWQCEHEWRQDIAVVTKWLTGASP
ncbi:SFR6 [Arabidopsis thaliana]|nr:SFR6 [Arabidopsis thaliana]